MGSPLPLNGNRCTARTLPPSISTTALNWNIKAGNDNRVSVTVDADGAVESKIRTASSRQGLKGIRFPWANR